MRARGTLIARNVCVSDWEKIVVDWIGGVTRSGEGEDLEIDWGDVRRLQTVLPEPGWIVNVSLCVVG